MEIALKTFSRISMKIILTLQCNHTKGDCLQEGFDFLLSARYRENRILNSFFD